MSSRCLEHARQRHRTRREFQVWQGWYRHQVHQAVRAPALRPSLHSPCVMQMAQILPAIHKATNVKWVSRGLMTHLTHYKHFWDNFYRPNNQFNSAKALKKASWSNVKHKHLHFVVCLKCFYNYINMDAESELELPESGLLASSQSPPCSITWSHGHRTLDKTRNLSSNKSFNKHFCS